ncbi:MAG: ABC transporter permease, partial [Bacteroidota bacterium]
HYFNISTRVLLRQKLYTTINTLGLAVGTGVALLICQYVYFERSYDQFHENYRNTHRVIIDEIRNDTDRGLSPYSDYALGVRAEEEIPEIEQHVRMYVEEYDAVITNPENNQPINEDATNLFYVDKSFLKVFNFPLKLGSGESVLDGVYNIVLTEETAEKYFGADNPIGKTLIISGSSSAGEYVVTGVLADLPVNSHLQFKFLLPLENYWELGNGGSVNRYGGWGRTIFVTYFIIDESANLSSVQGKLDQLLIKYKEEGYDPDNVVKKAQLQPIADIHLKSAPYTEADFVTNPGSIQNVQIFSIIALFILLIAWMNYINLSTARATQRAKEVGVRKSIGAFRRQLVSQFMLESVLINLLAAVLAISIAFLLLPILQQIIGEELELSLLQIPLFWGWFFAIITIGSLLSGLYPAFVLSGFKPTSMLSANKMSQVGNATLRKGLITFQFVISLALIAGTYLVYQQITFMKNQELGMDMEKVLVLKGPEITTGAPEVTDGTDMNQIRAYQAYSQSIFQGFINKVANHQSIAAVAGSQAIPGYVHNILRKDLRKEGEPESQGQYGKCIRVGLDFLKTYDLELIAGGWFTPDMSEDNFVVINEEVARTFGLGAPENAVQKRMVIGSSPRAVVGVVKNFHWQSPKDPHTPYVLRFDGGANNYISFKINLSNIQESLAHIEETYNTIYPGNPFEYFFIEDDFNRQYQADVQFGNLFFTFSVLAIFIACIGLFALVSYSATLRIKEIGIRKVLGASISNLMLLLSREYLVLLTIAITLAIPAIFIVGKAWLNNYAFKTDIGLDLLVIPASMLVLISVLTVSYRTYAAANKNPVDSLRIE